MSTVLNRTDSIVQADSFRGLGQWTVLEVQEITAAVSEVNFDVSGYTEFDELRIDIFNLTNVTNAVNINMTESTDGGSSYATSYNHGILRSNHVSVGTSAMARGYLATRSGHEIATSMVNYHYGRMSGWIEIYNWQSTSKRHLFLSSCIGWQGSSNPGGHFCAGGINPSAAATDYRITASSGNIDGGSYVLSGRSWN